MLAEWAQAGGMNMKFVVADKPMLAGNYYLQIKSMLMKGHAGHVGPSGR